jgi:site-specific DNA recombinase
VRRVKEEADRLGLRTKRSTTADGTARGGKPLSRGHIYQLLGNPIYTGQIAHKGRLYPGQHPALIDIETWNAVRDQLGANAGGHQSRRRSAEPSLLAGLLIDARGERLTPSHAVKNGRRYRYYVSAALISGTGTDHGQGLRLPAREVEDTVITILFDALSSPTTSFDRFGTANMSGDQIRRLLGRARRLAATLSASSGQRTAIIRGLVDKVIVDDHLLTIRVRRDALLGETVASPAGKLSFELKAAIAFRRCGTETKLVLPEQNRSARCDPALLRTIARGRAWFKELATGRTRSLQELATREGITRRYIRRLVNLAFLSPQLVEAILQGRQPTALTATRLSELDLPLDWREQHRLLAG